MILDEKYNVLKTLGKGGFGVVYLAEEVLTKRLVAIKHLNGQNARFPDLIIREIQHISKLKHQNVVLYHHYFIHNAQLYFVMEYCNNGTLEDRILQKDFTENELIQWMLELANVLRVLHQQKIYHRDIKPSNIFFGDDGTVKLGDFGIANGSNGTPMYMSPEALQKKVNKDEIAQVDIYALGITFFVALTGKYPYAIHDTAKLKRGESIQIQDQMLQKWQREIFRKAIDFNVAHRFRYAIQFHDALKANQLPTEFNERYFKVSEIVNLAKREMEKKRWMKAKTFLTTADNIDPNHLILLKNWGDFYIATGNFKEAKQKIQKALKLNPRLDLHLQLGSIYLELRNYSMAIPLLSDAIERKDLSTDDMNLLLKAYYYSKRFEQAAILSKLMMTQYPASELRLNNLVICNYCAYQTCSKDFLNLLKKSNHPIITFNLDLLIRSNLSSGIIKERLLFMDNRHIEFEQNVLALQIEQNGVFNYQTMTDGIIACKCNFFDDITILDSKDHSKIDFLIINNKNKVWLHILNRECNYNLNGTDLKTDAFLTGINELTIGNTTLRINADGSKLL